MADFGTFDLARAYAGAEEVKAAKQMSTLRLLQSKQAQRELDKPAMSYEDTVNQARIMNGGMQSIAADPSDENVRRNAEMMMKAGALPPGFDVNHVLAQPLEMRVDHAKKAGVQFKSFLDNAVDPEKRELAALAAKDRADALAARVEDQKARLAQDEKQDLRNADLRRDIAGLAAGNRTEPAPSMTEVVDPKDPKRLLRVDARVYKGGTLGDAGVLGVSGKEPAAAKAEETRGAGRESADTIIATLSDNYLQLRQGEGVSDTQADPLTNAATAVQTSGPGQFLGRVFGTENQSIRNQIKMARPILLQAIKNATGASAQQMNSNVELSLWLTAATDPTLDYQSNVQALSNLQQVIGSGKLPEPGAASASSAAAPAAATKAPPPSLLKPGVVTEFKNGQKWTLQNGQPVQVQ